jgi:transposase InsO family protein
LCQSGASIYSPKLLVFSDHGGEYVLGDFFTFCIKVSITHELIQAYTLGHNGVSEQKNRTFIEKAHLMVVDAQTPRFFFELMWLTPQIILEIDHP